MCTGFGYLFRRAIRINHAGRKQQIRTHGLHFHHSDTITAKFKEIIVDTNTVNRQGFFKCFAKLALYLISWFCVWRSDDTFFLNSRRKQRLAVCFSVWKKRETIHPHKIGRNHICRQLGEQILTDSFFRYIVVGNIIGTQELPVVSSKAFNNSIVNTINISEC